MLKLLINEKENLECFCSLAIKIQILDLVKVVEEVPFFSSTLYYQRNSRSQRFNQIFPVFKD